MKINTLYQVFELLREVGVINNRSDFSQDWLGQSECYLRTLQFKKAEPSIGVVAICASRLQRAGEEMVALPRYRPVGMRFIALSEKCHALVNEDAVELVLAG